MTLKILHRPENKLTAPIDNNSFLKWLWQSDSKRDWNFYSIEESGHNWDFVEVEHRK